MNINIRYPNISGTTEREQITQIKSYLRQLVEQLNWALPTHGAGDSSAQTASPKTFEVQGSEMSYSDLMSLIMQQLQEVQRLVDTLEKAEYVKASGWEADRFLVTDANGNVVARKLNFSHDEDGNLYYELEE